MYRHGAQFVREIVDFALDPREDVGQGREVR